MEQQQDFLNEMEDNKLPGMLNVLTILTFIGCLFLLWDVFKLFNIEKELNDMQEAMNKLGEKEMPAMIKSFTDNAMEMVRLRAANKNAMIVLELVSVALCVYGALQMRSRKMMGYYLYLIGEILPIVASAIFIGSIAFKGFFVIGYFFPLLFIILYTTQRKYLNQ